MPTIAGACEDSDSIILQNAYAQWRAIVDPQDVAAGTQLPLEPRAAQDRPVETSDEIARRTSLVDDRHRFSAREPPWNVDMTEDHEARGETRCRYGQ